MLFGSTCVIYCKATWRLELKEETWWLCIHFPWPSINKPFNPETYCTPVHSLLWAPDLKSTKIWPRDEVLKNPVLSTNNTGM